MAEFSESAKGILIIDALDATTTTSCTYMDVCKNPKQKFLTVNYTVERNV